MNTIDITAILASASCMVAPKPVLKWAGGKRSLAGEVMSRVPAEFGWYHEPFFGGGAVYFELLRTGRVTADRAVLSDALPRLIETYEAIRTDPSGAMASFGRLARVHTKEHYLAVRDAHNRSDCATEARVDRAARFLSLNRTCYNGLHRVNSRGGFNVPFGDFKGSPTLDEPNLLAVAETLRGAQLSCQDFEEALERTEESDFVYLDPPYDRCFVQYTAAGFSRVDQHRLADAVRRIHERGVRFVLSNASTAFVRSLYAGFAIETVSAPRAISSNGKARASVEEYLVS